MRHFTLIILFFTCWIAASGQRADTLRKYLDNSLAFTNKRNASYGAMAVKAGDHWLLYAVYPDTGVLLKSYFKDRNLTTKDGPFTLYHRNNIKAMTGIYVNNVHQGEWKFWYENGQLKDSGMIKNNQMVNGWYSWSETGQLMKIANYLPPDSIPDDNIVFASPRERNIGLLEMDTIISSPHGPWITYYANAKIKDSGMFKHSKREGEWTTWYETGIKESNGSYKENKQEGEWIYFFENGRISTREQYRNNKVVAMECFDEQGNSAGSFCSILKPPVPILERFIDFNNYLLDNIFWPKELDGKEVNGMVRGQYTITKEGKLINFMIRETPHELLAKETERFFRSIEQWSPAVSHNRIIEFTVTFEVPFFR